MRVGNVLIGCIFDARRARAPPRPRNDDEARKGLLLRGRGGPIPRTRPGNCPRQVGDAITRLASFSWGTGFEGNVSRCKQSFIHSLHEGNSRRRGPYLMQKKRWNTSDRRRGHRGRSARAPFALRLHPVDPPFPRRRARPRDPRGHPHQGLQQPQDLRRLRAPTQLRQRPLPARRGDWRPPPQQRVAGCDDDPPEGHACAPACRMSCRARTTTFSPRHTCVAEESDAVFRCLESCLVPRIASANSSLLLESSSAEFDVGFLPPSLSRLRESVWHLGSSLSVGSSGRSTLRAAIPSARVPRLFHASVLHMDGEGREGFAGSLPRKSPPAPGQVSPAIAGQPPHVRLASCCASGCSYRLCFR